jgi:hypothetical protein
MPKRYEDTYYENAPGYNAIKLELIVRIKREKWDFLSKTFR